MSEIKEQLNRVDEIGLRLTKATVDFVNTLQEIQAKHDALVKDAARYRWLREQHWNKNVIGVVPDPKKALDLGIDTLAMTRLDNFIDKIMAVKDE